jgi:hypothetical protein
MELLCSERLKGSLPLKAQNLLPGRLPLLLGGKQGRGVGRVKEVEGETAGPFTSQQVE